MTFTFKCSQCKNERLLFQSRGSGYIRKSNNHKICYECCGINDKRNLSRYDHAELYLNDKQQITNWAGTLKISPSRIKKSHNTFGVKRLDIWFVANGDAWYGVKYGDSTEVVRCKKLKD